MDAQFVLVPDKLIHHQETAATGSPSAFVRLDLPSSLISQLSRAKLELGDQGDPSNSWIFGEVAELFDYKFAGSFAVPSGVAGVLTPESWEDWKQKSQSSVNWGQFKAELVNGLNFPAATYPFLWAGAVLEAPSASIFTTKKASGILLSSDTADGDTP